MKQRYRATTVTTEDYGSFKTVQATLSRIPDGSEYGLFPNSLKINVPEGTTPGTVYILTLDVEQING